MYHLISKNIENILRKSLSDLSFVLSVHVRNILIAPKHVHTCAKVKSNIKRGTISKQNYHIIIQNTNQIPIQ